MAIKFTDGINGSETIRFEIIVCCKCNVPFMVTDTHRARLVSTSEMFFCPAGHEQHYTTPSCEKKKADLEKEVADHKRWNDSLIQSRNKAWNDLDELKRQNRELRSKPCPHCKKKVINLSRHIKKYHNVKTI